MGEIGFKLVTFYCVMAFIKLMFSVTSLPVAIVTASRLLTRRRGTIAWGYALSFVLLAILASFLCWIPLLFKERHRFFSVYESRGVMRDVVKGYRSSH